MDTGDACKFDPGERYNCENGVKAHPLRAWWTRLSHAAQLEAMLITW